MSGRGRGRGRRGRGRGRTAIVLDGDDPHDSSYQPPTSVNRRPANPPAPSRRPSPEVSRDFQPEPPLGRSPVRAPPPDFDDQPAASPPPPPRRRRRDLRAQPEPEPEPEPEPAADLPFAAPVDDLDPPRQQQPAGPIFGSIVWVLAAIAVAVLAIISVRLPPAPKTMPNPPDATDANHVDVLIEPTPTPPPRFSEICAITTQWHQNSLSPDWTFFQILDLDVPSYCFRPHRSRARAGVFAKSGSCQLPRPIAIDAAYRSHTDQKSHCLCRQVNIDTEKEEEGDDDDDNKFEHALYAAPAAIDTSPTTTGLLCPSVPSDARSRCLELSLLNRLTAVLMDPQHLEIYTDEFLPQLFKCLDQPSGLDDSRQQFEECLQRICTGGGGL